MEFFQSSLAPDVNEQDPPALPRRSCNRLWPLSIVAYRLLQSSVVHAAVKQILFDGIPWIRHLNVCDFSRRVDLRGQHSVDAGPIRRQVQTLVARNNFVPKSGIEMHTVFIDER